MEYLQIKYSLAIVDKKTTPIFIKEFDIAILSIIFVVPLVRIDEPCPSTMSCAIVIDNQPC